MTNENNDRERRSYVKAAAILAKNCAIKLVVPKSDRRLRSTEDLTDGRDIYEYDCSPPPITILLLTIFQIGFFIYYASEFGHVTEKVAIPFDSHLIYDPHRRYEVWRYITYMFIHANGVHIFFNVIMQLMLGISLELVHKHWRVWLLYMSGVLAGSLGTSISDPNTFLLGASSGAYALLTGHLATLIINYKQMFLALYQLIAVLIIVSVDCGTAVYNRYWLGNSDKIGYAAHFSGAVAGLLVGIVVLKNIKRLQWEQLLWWISLLTFVILILVMIVWNLAYPSYFAPSK